MALRDSMRAKIHLFNDLPHLYEIDDMMKFCAGRPRLYLCAAPENQDGLLKFFREIGVRIEGLLVSKIEDRARLPASELPVLSVDEVIAVPGSGVILNVADRYYRYFIPKFRKAGYQDYFVMTEYNKRTIADQLKPRPIEEMTFEINLADHCNLSCQMCDHFSQLSKPCFVNLDTFERDLRQMGKIYHHNVACITLLGGEPLLHRGIIDCLNIARREFPDAELIILTNGLLLLDWEKAPEGNLWQACRDLNVHITVTIYPLNFDYAALERKAQEYGVLLGMSSNIHADELTRIVKISDKHPFKPNCDAPRFGYISCLYFNKFNVLREGRYYMCPIAACIGIFNQYFKQDLKLAEADSLDIYQVDDWRQLSEFAATRTPFCGYCDLMNWRPHSPWKASSKKIEEYI